MGKPLRVLLAEKMIELIELQEAEGKHIPSTILIELQSDGNIQTHISVRSTSDSYEIQEEPRLGSVRKSVVWIRDFTVPLYYPPEEVASALSKLFGQKFETNEERKPLYSSSLTIVREDFEESLWRLK